MGWGGFDEEEEDPRTLREAANGTRQARRTLELIRAGLVAKNEFRLAPDTVVELQGIAMEGLVPTAGRLRVRSDVEISGSRHVLPDHDEVPTLLTEACDFVNERKDAEPLFLAAYILWRICWIHPFDDGNGRTARAASYLVLSVRLGREITGAMPVPNRFRYAPIAYRNALEAADAAWATGKLDVSAMQRLVGFYLKAQLRDDPVSILPDFADDA